MLVEPIMSLLETAEVGVIGKTIFGHYMPADIKTGVLVVSGLSGNFISYELPGWRKDDRFQIIVRAPNVTAAHLKARQVKSALTIQHQTVIPSGLVGIPNLNVLYIRPLHDPIMFPRLQSGLFECSLNCVTTYAFDSTVI